MFFESIGSKLYRHRVMNNRLDAMRPEKKLKHTHGSTGTEKL